MNQPESRLTDAITRRRAGNRIWHQERVVVEVTERICELMAAARVNRSTLAKRMKKTKGYVTHLLSGSANLTLRTVSNMYFALDREFHPADGPLNRSKLQFEYTDDRDHSPLEPTVATFNYKMR